jgi:NitT/TauT family transport system substrate-binding protein
MNYRHWLSEVDRPRLSRAAAGLGAGLMLLGAGACSPGAANPSAPAASKPAGAAAGAAPASAAAPAAASAPATPQKVTMVLSWVGYQPHHMPFWLARERGWYAEQGLDVTIEDSRGYGQVMQFLTAEKTEFGLVGASSLAQATAKQNVAIKLVGLVQQKENNSLRYFLSSGIRSPKDMEGRSAGLVGGSIQELLLPAFGRAAGFDASKVEVIHVDIQTSGRAFAAGQFDLTNSAVGSADTIVYERKGTPTGQFIYADYVPLLGPGIAVTNKTLAERPALVRGFTKATQRALEYMITSPREAVLEASGIVARNVQGAPEGDLVAEAAFEAVPSLMVTKSTEGKPAGWSSPDDWRQMIDLLRQYDDFPRVPPVDELMTNQFVES